MKQNNDRSRSQKGRQVDGFRNRESLASKGVKVPNQADDKVQSAHRPLRSPVKDIFPVGLNRMKSSGSRETDNCHEGRGVCGGLAQKPQVTAANRAVKRQNLFRS